MITPLMLNIAPIPPPLEPPPDFVVLIAVITIAIASIVTITRALSSKQA
ncbi:hypothetical protein N836_06945 [Leptolyngbya sp. Heron Island J]|nr:hypothetical protein [Leptolyngbya sp. Heron Island J]ESA36640.1 hypothetical protein N836_06945 [Leptolyngbya sp. Heron Island J]